MRNGIGVTIINVLEIVIEKLCYKCGRSTEFANTPNCKWCLKNEQKQHRVQEAQKGLAKRA